MARVVQRWVATAAVAIIGAGVSVPAVQAPTSPATRIAAALDLYASGDTAQALERRPFDGLEIATVLPALDEWIGPADAAVTPAARAARDKRRQTAARFALDVTSQREGIWMLIGVPIGDGGPTPNELRLGGPDTASGSASPGFDTQSFNAPLVTWACAQMPKAGPVESWEPWWWLTSIALLQEAGEWGLLGGNTRMRYSGSRPPSWRLAMRSELVRGHLGEARERLGPQPRLRLAEAVTAAAALTDATKRFAFGAGPGPAVQGRFDVLRHLEDASRTVNRRRFDESERLFEALLDEPGFEAEVALRLAQLRLLRRDWPAARRWIDRGAAATDSRMLLATADYFRGWIAERTDRPADALAAYRSAHARYDRSPSLNTQFATQLMLAGERTQAARVLERFIADPYNHTWRDLWLLLVEGDARRAPEYARRMREAR